jgi:Dyp-type peroxidase family
MPDLDVRDIQGLILHGYRRMTHARHLLLRIDDPAAFRHVLRDLSTEERHDGQYGGPFVTVADDWRYTPPVDEEPTHCVNIGLTYSGLQRLGLSEEHLNTFPKEFREGAVHRAAEVGDTGANAPEHWIEPLNGARHEDVHVVLSLYALDADGLDAVDGEVRPRAECDGAAAVLEAVDAAALYDDEEHAGYVHFGYRDGLSQPRIEGVQTKRLPPDGLDPVPAGAFVLGQPSQWTMYSYPVPQPAQLGENGSFAAFRIARQDVAAFERFLTDESDGSPAGRELVAARLCGRWRNGVALVTSPESDTPPDSPDELNAFDYATVHSDPVGERCPLGSHIRRANPRGQPIMGGGGSKHRIVRRGLPYGSRFDPDHPDDEERGLVGMFICVSLRDQFEFVMHQWLNDGVFAAGLGRTRDPLAGQDERAAAAFTAPGTPPLQVNGLPSFVTTRGAAYCFLPSMKALRYLATL